MSIKNQIRNSLPAGLLIALLASCQPHTMYHSFRTLPKDGWNKSDTLVFPIPTKDIQAENYELQIELRHTKEFAYQSLWVVVYQNSQDSMQFTADTLQCVLVNEKGRFIGTGLNNYYQTNFPLKTVTLDKEYTPIFKLAHYMKKGRIEGIHDVGIRLVEK